MANGKWPTANRPSLVMAISAITSFTISRRGANRHSKACFVVAGSLRWRRAGDDGEFAPMERICVSGLSLRVSGAAGPRRPGIGVPELSADVTDSGAGRPAAALGDDLAHIDRGRSAVRSAGRPSWEPPPHAKKVAPWRRSCLGPLVRRTTAVKSREKRQMFWMLSGGAALFALILTGVLLASRGRDAAAPPTVTPSANLQAAATSPLPATDQPGRSEWSEVAFSAAAEPLARTFLEATRVEDLLPVVRHPDVTEARIRRHYPGGKIDPPGLTKFNPDSAVVCQGTISAIKVRTRAFDDKQLAFVNHPAGHQNRLGKLGRVVRDAVG